MSSESTRVRQGALQRSLRWLNVGCDVFCPEIFVLGVVKDEFTSEKGQNNLFNINK